MVATCRLCQMGASPCDNRPSSLGQARARAASALDKQELRLHLRLRAAPEQLPMCQICVIWVYLFSLPAARQGTFCFCVVVLEELPQPLLLLLPLPSFVLLELEAPILHFLLPLPIAVLSLGSAVSASAAAVFFEAGGTAAAAQRSSSAAAAAGFFYLELEEEQLPLLHLLLPLAFSYFALEPARLAGPPALVSRFELATVLEAAAIY